MHKAIAQSSIQPDAQDLLCHTCLSKGVITAWLLPGDLARWLPDGNIEFLGRIDFQVQSLEMSQSAYLSQFLSMHAISKQ